MARKIIFISNYFGNGGAARVIQVLSKTLSDKEDCEVKILSFRDDDKKYEVPDKVLYECVNTKSKNKMIQKIERIIRLRKILKNNKDAIIISFEYFVNMQTIVAKMFLKNKLIISERNDPYRVGNNKKGLRNFLYKFADCLVCQTQDAKEYFPQKIQDKSVIIPNPIKSNLPKRFEGKRDKIIVTFCRIEKQKNLKMLIDAFEMLIKKHDEYTLSIYGDGKEKDALINYVDNKKMKNKVLFYDFQSNIHEKIVNSTMFVSSSNYEGISNSMIEAMGIGLPTLVTDCPCGGARMMIENQVNGILVPVGDVQSMYESMKKIIENPDFAEMLSRNATDINERLEENKICSKWIDLIR